MTEKGDWFPPRLSEAMASLNTAQAKPPAILHHYTNARGLLGIGRSGFMYATNLRYMNDARELDYALDLTTRVLAQRATQLPELTPLLDAVTREIREPGGRAAFVVSFSRNGDQLSQWRGYASDGTGYALGFITQQLLPLGQKQGFRLAKCIYDEETQLKLIHAIVDDAVGQLVELDGRGEAYGLSLRMTVMNTLQDSFMFIAPAIKHPSFAEEDEWRLVRSFSWRADPDAIVVRQGRSTLIPYLPFKLIMDGHRAEISKLRVGPSHGQELAREAAKALVPSYCVTIDHVTCSEIPYRQV